MQKATAIRKMTNLNGEATLYRLQNPVSFGTECLDEHGDLENPRPTTEFVIVSAVSDTGKRSMFGRSLVETFIFPATADGKAISWGELPGSYKGGLDHAQALRGLGYEIA